MRKVALSIPMMIFLGVLSGLVLTSLTIPTIGYTAVITIPQAILGLSETLKHDAASHFLWDIFVVFGLSIGILGSLFGVLVSLLTTRPCFIGASALVSCVALYTFSWPAFLEYEPYPLVRDWWAYSYELTFALGVFGSIGLVLRITRLPTLQTKWRTRS
jgi:hypothetical protein